MLFHVDESGNTGNNLFDESQPTLSYGLLSSKLNVDALGVDIHRRIIKELGVESIHANQLGVDRLSSVYPLLMRLQQKFKFDFDYYFIEKKAYALVTFFDSVFDAGINPAVKWDVYWTPLRYTYIHGLAPFFDEYLLRESWSLYLEKNINNHAERISALLSELSGRVGRGASDPRFKEVVLDALQYGIDNPLQLDFGTAAKDIASPNAVGFQFVVSSMAQRLRKKKKKDASSIIVDRQAQFNAAQITTHDISKAMEVGLKKASPEDRRFYVNHPIHHGLDREELLRSRTPSKKIVVSSSEDSVGLQICDTYLWIFNRIISNKPVSRELRHLGQILFSRSMVDSISMNGMAYRWKNFEAILPKFEDLTPEQMKHAAENIEKHRTKVRDIWSD